MLFIKQKYLPYRIAFFSVGATLLVKLGLEHLTGITSSFSLWLIAISISTWYGSIISGLTSVFLAALASHYFFTNPSSTLNSLEFVLFVIEGLLISALTANFQSSKQQSDTDKTEAQINLKDLLQSQRSLRQGEELYRTLTQNLPNGVVFLFDRDMRFMGAEGTELQIFGLPKEEFQGKTLHETVLPETYELIEPAYRSTLQGTPMCIEIPYNNQVYLIQTFPVKDENSKILTGLAIFQNVTNRKQAEAKIIKLNQALNRRVTELQTLLEVIPTGIGIAEDPECRTIRANPALAKLLGIPVDANASLSAPNDERPTNFKVYQSGRELAPEELAMQYATTHGVEILDSEIEVVRNDGVRINLSQYAAPLFDEDGKVRGCVSVFLDITQRNQAERKLQAARDQLQTVLEAVPGIVSWVSSDLCYLGVNKHLADSFNLPPEAFVGQDIGFLASGNGFREFVQNFFAGDQSEALYELKSISADRSYLIVAQKYDQNKAAFLIGIDITEQKRVEEELRQKTEELAEINRVKDEFVAVLSHELRTPMHNLHGWAQLLLTESEMDEALKIEGLETIERNARLQVRLIDDLLDLARMQKGEMNLEIEPVDLASVIRSAADTIRLSAETKGIQIQLHLDAAVSNVLGDAIRLQQVVWNLLSNAIKFSSKNESVEVRLEQVESQAQITVIDRGRGIEAEFIPFVFERFSQRDASTTRSAGGLGLGLAIALTIVELHNGNITAASAGFGKGSTFTVRLPIVKMTGQLSNDELVLGELLHGNQKIAQLQNLCILVVDDDADARILMQTVLQNAGADVLVAASAKEALALLEQQPPALLISDISMPDEDGFTLIRQVRSRTMEKGGQIPAIALTAFAEAKNEQRILKAGFQLFIAKPIKPMELVDKIIEVLKT
ncbi:hybrid sensor histidine kinase/response regulator [Nostoc sp. 'Peltigera membranacea cyanobiont' N6]|uniref:hybrid sensor histidine kinase/response regulator n=1 Tax=Nostoc sp. 'Peltigera membranacea cyanobiont' N6 TaxID=1261031 RepID=UPI000CF3222D|nr:ATP-binding protein [Nostoc sp. 'Peltigera membranacea cyanobiont' N6]AVH68413.1 signal transduction histidine kinase [Nostoc sp. 'Peltigera membranacea cyanobiont' N6]